MVGNFRHRLARSICYTVCREEILVIVVEIVGGVYACLIHVFRYSVKHKIQI